MTGEAAVWVVIPTYDEAENLESIVGAVRANLPASRRILVVDDASPDGTGEIADRLAAGSDDLEVLHRQGRSGLGPAYVAGFRRALGQGAQRIVQMDADFSHDPVDVPRLLRAADDADLAIGSRYVPGGGVAEWGRLRRFVSHAGGTYARIVLGTGVRDLTAGFKCWRRETLEGIDLGAVEARGYAFQIEMTYRALQAGFAVVEVPIVFHDRRVGASKMSGPIAFEAVWRTALLRFRARP